MFIFTHKMVIGDNNGSPYVCLFNPKDNKVNLVIKKIEVASSGPIEVSLVAVDTKGIPPEIQSLDNRISSSILGYEASTLAEPYIISLIPKDRQILIKKIKVATMETEELANELDGIEIPEDMGLAVIADYHNSGVGFITNIVFEHSIENEA